MSRSLARHLPLCLLCASSLSILLLPAGPTKAEELLRPARPASLLGRDAGHSPSRWALLARLQEDAPTPTPSADQPSAPDGVPALDQTVPTEEPPAEPPPGEAVPEEQPPIESPPGDSEPLPQGETIDKGLGLRLKGYFRSEYKYNVPNLFYALDQDLGLWTPRGSPYAAFNLLPPVQHDAYLELNLEGGWDKLDNFTLYADASFIASAVPNTQSSFEELQDALIATGALSPDAELETVVPIPGASSSSDFVRNAQLRLQLNEAYATMGHPDWFSLTVGKRRLSWGSALTWAPLDVFNPPRNPLEPNLLREGSYNLALDFIHFSNLTGSLVYAPRVVENERGLPDTWDFTQNQAGARLFSTILDTDVNLAYFYNRGRSYGGLSLSRYFDLIEVHAEGLLQRGRPTWLVKRLSYPSDDPYASLKAPFAVDQYGLEGCDGGGVCRPNLDLVVGGRYNFTDNSLLLLEYYYRGGGYDDDEYRDYLAVTNYLQAEMPSLALTLAQSQGGSVPEAEQTAINDSWTGLLNHAPYLYGDLNIRRHYVALTYWKALVYDLFEPHITVIFNADDLSATIFPSVDFLLAKGTGGPGTVKMMAGLLFFVGPPGSQADLYPNKCTANLRMTAYF